MSLRHLLVVILIAAGLQDVSPSEICGHPVSILEINNGTMVLGRRHLDLIMQTLDPDTEVGVIAIAGAFRKGKSFLMNFFLQYLEYRETHGPALPTDLTDEGLGQHTWLRDIDRKCGFPFKRGDDRHTKGIDALNRPFPILQNDGRNRAVLVVDSQGLYDENTDPDDNVRLFTFVSLISSSLMWNSQGNIDSLAIEQIKHFLDYAKTKSNISSTNKYFQRLIFVIRDYLADEPGEASGQALVNKFLKPSSRQSVQVRELANDMNKGFSSIGGFTLPPPGSAVVGAGFDGSLYKVDRKFLTVVQQLVIRIVDSWEPRKPLIEALKTQDFLEYADNIVSLYNSQLPASELIRVQERSLISRLMDKIANEERIALTMLEHEQSAKPDSYFIGRRIEDISQDIRTRFAQIVDERMREFKKHETSDLRVDQGVDGKWLTAVEMLQLKCEQAFNARITQYKETMASRKHQIEEPLRELERWQAFNESNIVTDTWLLLDGLVAREWLTKSDDYVASNERSQLTEALEQWFGGAVAQEVSRYGESRAGQGVIRRDSNGLKVTAGQELTMRLAELWKKRKDDVMLQLMAQREEKLLTERASKEKVDAYLDRVFVIVSNATKFKEQSVCFFQFDASSPESSVVTSRVASWTAPLKQHAIQSLDRDLANAVVDRVDGRRVSGTDYMKQGLIRRIQVVEKALARVAVDERDRLLKFHRLVSEKVGHHGCNDRRQCFVQWHSWAVKWYVEDKHSKEFKLLREKACSCNFDCDPVNGSPVTQTSFLTSVITVVLFAVIGTSCT